jgi:peptide methionine sulfoxide reductase msrA/msrB
MKYQISILLLLLTFMFKACAQQNNSNNNTTQLQANKMKFEINKTDKEWQQTLTVDQYYILREKGTERPYTGKFLMHKDTGNYTCAACGNVLFSSTAKFDSHCGWPSFDKEIKEGTIIEVADNTLGMRRTEIMCGKCGGHLGHVFNDGPTATGIRYCVNSVSLGFEAAASKPQEANANKDSIQQLTVAGGCFWCIEAVYLQMQGVLNVESGYMGGNTPNPTYKEVCTGTTNHAEVVRVTYNSNITNVAELLKVFFTVHNPTTLNKQGADEGTQYRSAIFYANSNEQQLAQQIISELNTAGAYNNPIVTTVEPLSTFYKAEDYHQNYYNLNKSQPYCQMVIQPKLAKFEKVFADKLKQATK